jgi:hypothetical protein
VHVSRVRRRHICCLHCCCQNSKIAARTPAMAVCTRLALAVIALLSAITAAAAVAASASVALSALLLPVPVRCTVGAK